jgi:hypothetical protein
MPQALSMRGSPHNPLPSPKALKFSVHVDLAIEIIELPLQMGSNVSHCLIVDGRANTLYEHVQDSIGSKIGEWLIEVALEQIL